MSTEASIDQVTQRVVPARGAAPAMTTAAKSVFDLAGPAAPTPATAHKAKPKRARTNRPVLRGPDGAGIDQAKAARAQALARAVQLLAAAIAVLGERT